MENFFLNLFQDIVFQTVIAGVLVFVFSEVIQKFILEPLQKLKGIIGRIDSFLLLYYRFFVTPMPLNEKTKECRNLSRTLGSDLGSSYNAISSKCFLLWLHFIIHPKQLQESVSDLGFLANNVGTKDSGEKNDERIKRIRKNLKIPQRWIEKK